MQNTALRKGSFCVLPLRNLAFAVWPILILLLAPLHDSQASDPQAKFDSAYQLFVHGYLEKSQQISARGYELFRHSNPDWAERFRFLEVEDMEWRGLHQDALRTLEEWAPRKSWPEGRIIGKTLEAVAQSHLQRSSDAESNFAEAEDLCAKFAFSACGAVLRARGVSAIAKGQLPTARWFLLQSLSFAQRHQDGFSEATALLNLSVVALQSDHFDEAMEWAKSAYDSAAKLRAEDLEQNALGNLGWAYFELGDTEKSLELFLEAGNAAKRLGDSGDEIRWLTTAGYAFQRTSDLKRAGELFYSALNRAREIGSTDETINSLQDLAHNSVELGNYSQAEGFIAQVEPLIQANRNRLDELTVLLAQGRIAAARREDKQAESIFTSVMHDPASQTSMRLGAGHELARLYAVEGNLSAAERTYKATLVMFEAARDELKKEDSKLPFLANATRIYDDYISFLVNHGKVEEALAVADGSRAKTLAQGLGIGVGRDPQRGNPQAAALARSTGATLLFYWLGEKQSYLWTITPHGTRLFPLPAQREIATHVKNYHKALLGMNDPIEAGNEDGRALYQMLVAPASSLIHPDAHVIVLADGELSKLNFETLIVPGPHPHYWIEDAMLLSAPSLRMMASAQPVRAGSGKLLLMGNAISAGPEYPELPMAATEMKLVAGRFSSTDATVFSRAQANAESYLASKPEQFGYIHFVTHAVASSTDPLDSAILLSRGKSGEDGFKLYARQILTRPIHARLVTISACYGSGMRSYAGEGLVGLSWAFLHAGAHNVIGALWEVSDDSTPQLMDALYQGLQSGQTPAAALRHAKLLLLHTTGNFRKPFYWAPFQIYSGL